MNTHNTSTALVGSIANVAKARGISPEDAMLGASVVVAMDTSISMCALDAGPGHNEARYTVACDELAVLQSQRPGEIIVMSWSDRAEWCLDGVPVNLAGGTNILAALQEFIDAGLDGLVPMTIMADGDVAEVQKDAAKRIVRGMKSSVNTIFIGDANGPDGKSGAKFLRDLAKAGRGQNATTIEPGMLAKPAILMLDAPKANTDSPAVINL